MGRGRRIYQIIGLNRGPCPALGPKICCGRISGPSLRRPGKEFLLGGKASDGAWEANPVMEPGDAMDIGKGVRMHPESVRPERTSDLDPD
jgi:hypothetical protein